MFWSDNGMPYIENICRDRFAMLISRELEQFGIWELTEADMPKSKRVDLAFACADLQLPIEVNCQWHDESSKKRACRRPFTLATRCAGVLRPGHRRMASLAMSIPGLVPL